MVIPEMEEACNIIIEKSPLKNGYGLSLLLFKHESYVHRQLLLALLYYAYVISGIPKGFSVFQVI